jgi:serine protease
MIQRVLIHILFVCFSITLYAQKSEHIKGSFLIQLAQNQKIETILTRLAAEKIYPTNQRCLSEIVNIWQVNIDKNIDDKAVLKTLTQHPSVLNAQFNFTVSARTTTQPNDPFLNNQWHILNLGQTGGTAGADVQATFAWDISTGGITTDGDTVVVAIIDEGFDPIHPDLAANTWHNWKEIPNNGIDDDRNGYVDDFQGWNTVTNTDDISGGVHATQVSGVLGAVGNNGRGISGINWRVKMMSIKFGGEVADVIIGYNYALNMRKLYDQTNGKKGAFIVATNSSFGREGLFPINAPIWCALYDSLGNAGVLNVASTANSNIDVGVTGDLPSTCPSDMLIMVTSSDSKDLKPNGAAYSTTHVDVAAPGANVYTTQPNNNFGNATGTSYACPVVAGIAALAYAVPCSDFINFAKNNPRAGVLQLKEWILKSVDTKADFQGKISTNGRVNAYKTLQKVINFCGNCRQPSGFKFSNTPSKSDINFSIPQGLSITAQYRRKGTTAWTPITKTTPPLSISGLETCSEYELEMKTNCTTTETSTTYATTFKTEGCCTAPDDVLIHDITQGTFALRFSNIQSATGYDICLQDAASGNCVSQRTYTDTNLVFNNLNICNTYKVNIKSLCSDNRVSNLNSYIVKTKGCGPCLDKEYCKAGGSRSALEWIDSFAISNFKLNTGKNNGYIKFDTIATTLKSGKKYRLALKPGYDTDVFFESLRVWIDLNGDGDFADKGEQIWEVPKFNTTVASDTVLIPLSDFEGVTRLRVAMKYVGSTGGIPPQYCEPFDDGEVEDYCVRLERATALPIISENEILVYPNPFSNYIILENIGNTNKIRKLELMALDGRILYVKKFDLTETVYLVDNLPPLSTGIFFLKIETEKGVLAKKMVRY